MRFFRKNFYLSLTFLVVATLGACSSTNESSLNETQVAELIELRVQATTQAAEAQSELAELEATLKPEPTAVPKSDMELILAQIAPSIVLIQTPDSVGTGFFINDSGLIATAQHVIDGFSEVDVAPNKANFLGKANVIYENLFADVALLDSGITSPSYLNLSNVDEIGSGHEVVSIGFPGFDYEVGVEPSVSKGILSRKLDYEDLTYFEHDSRVLSGNSGGPLVSLQTGEVIGMNQVTFTDDAVGDALYYALSSADLIYAVQQSNSIYMVGNLVKVVPTPTPMPTATPTPVPTPRPTPIPTLTPTPKPRATATPTPTPTPGNIVIYENSPLACTTSVQSYGTLQYLPTYGRDLDEDGRYDYPEWEADEIAAYTETLVREEDSVAVSKLSSKHENAVFSVEFKITEGDETSFGMRLRSHKNPLVTVNNGWESDYFIFRFDTSYTNFDWRHHVRNKFIGALDGSSLMDSGSVNIPLNTGPRGFNKFELELNGEYAKIWLNDRFVTTITLEPIKPDTVYFNDFIGNFYSDESVTSDIHLRNFAISCVE